MSYDLTIRTRRGSTAVLNEAIYNSNLSFPTLGIYLYALSLPPRAAKGWEAFSKRGLGRTAILAALTELEEAGYRWRFLVRVRRTRKQADGTTKMVAGLRTVTLFFDAPVAEHDALAQLEGNFEYEFVISCPQTGAKYATPTTTKTISEPASNEVPEPISGGDSLISISDQSANNGTETGQIISENGTNKCVCAGHCACRPGDMHDRSTHRTGTPSHREALKSSLRSDLSKPTYLPGAHPPHEDPGSGLVGEVGEDPPAAEQPSSEPGTTPSTGGMSVLEAGVLVTECLPAGLRQMDRDGLIQVGGMLAHRLEAGWNAKQIRAVMDQPLPAKVTRVAGLVRHRLEQHVVPELAPDRLEQHRAAAQAAEAEARTRSRILAQQARDEAEQAQVRAEAIADCELCDDAGLDASGAQCDHLTAEDQEMVDSFLAKIRTARPIPKHRPRTPIGKGVTNSDGTGRSGPAGTQEVDQDAAKVG